MFLGKSTVFPYRELLFPVASLCQFSITSSLSSESFSRTLSEVLLLKTISSCLADMALSESMMFLGWPHCPFSQ